MKRFQGLVTFLVMLLLLGVVSCTTQDRQTNRGADATTQFDTYKENFLAARWEMFPETAFRAGLYDFDNRLSVPDADYRTAVIAFNDRWLTRLDEIDEKALSDSDRIDYRLIHDYLKRSTWNVSVFRDWAWDPSNYNVASSFALILNTDYKPLEERLHSFYQRMSTVPAFYEAAEGNLEAVSLPHLQLAIRQNEGGLPVFSETFRKSVAESKLSPKQKQQFDARAEQAIAAIKDYVEFLKTREQAISSGDTALSRSFRIGGEMFEQKFQHEIVSRYSAAEIYAKAVAKRKALHTEMADITAMLWDKYFPGTAKPEDALDAIGMMINAVARTHVERDRFVDAVRAQIPELEAFVIEHDLLDMDASRPLVVRETPAYQRGVAGASINAPGPFDATANTYYNVTPLDEFTEEGAESYLREYNARTMQILNIHEAVPGHYTQLMHANKSPSLIKSLFGNGAMVEGWAVYAEKMMLEAGYGNGEPELTLMYDKWILRSVVNTIIDYDIQVKNASEADILHVLKHEAFQEDSEATGKWRRATLSQVQLSSYFTGFTEIYELREDFKAERGDGFVLKDFHNRFLSYGRAPVKYIRELML